MSMPDNIGNARSLRNQIRNEIAGIVPHDSVERSHLDDALAWIDSGDDLFRREKPATPPKHLVSYIAVVCDEHILLVDHRNARLWLPAGGHVDPGEHPRVTAARELREELGIVPGEEFRPPLMLSVAETVGVTSGHTDVSLWYLFSAAPGLVLRFDGSEFQSVQWFPFDALPLDRTDPNLARFVAKCLTLPRWRGPVAAR